MPSVAVGSAEVNQCYIDSVDYLRQDLRVTYNSEAGTVKVVNSTDTLIDNIIFSDITPDDTQPFASFEAMKSWFDNNIVFNGYLVTALPNSDCWLVNRKPLKKGLMFFDWDDANEELEVRHSQYSYQNKPIAKAHYSLIVREDEVAGFESYAALIQWLITNTFTDTTPA